MRGGKLFVFGVLLALAFWAGHAYSVYQSTHLVLLLEESASRSNADSAVRAVELLDARGASRARAALLQIAAQDVDRPSAEWETNWQVILSPPVLGTDTAIEFLRERDRSERAALREKIVALKASAQPTSN